MKNSNKMSNDVRIIYKCMLDFGGKIEKVQVDNQGRYAILILLKDGGWVDVFLEPRPEIDP